MRKIITAALLAAVALPAVATAQSRAELARDRQEIRQEQRDVERAQRRGDWRDVREQREDVRDARREYREDRRDYRDDRRDDRRNWRNDGAAQGNWGRDDWRSYRRDHRDVYSGRGWRAPFAYQNFRPGVRIAPVYFGGRYAITDPARFRLPRANGTTRWVRHYNDVLLVDWRRGVVLDVIRNFYW